MALSGESYWPLTPIPLQKYRATPPIAIAILVHTNVLLLAESSMHHQCLSRYSSHFYCDNFAEVLGSEVVETPPICAIQSELLYASQCVAKIATKPLQKWHCWAGRIRDSTNVGVVVNNGIVKTWTFGPSKLCMALWRVMSSWVPCAFRFCFSCGYHAYLGLSTILGGCVKRAPKSSPARGALWDTGFHRPPNGPF